MRKIIAIPMGALATAEQSPYHRPWASFSQPSRNKTQGELGLWPREQLAHRVHFRHQLSSLLTMQGDDENGAGLIHYTHTPVVARGECHSLVAEAEAIAATAGGWGQLGLGRPGWLPLTEMPRANAWFKQRLDALFYPFLRASWSDHLPPLDHAHGSLRVVDAFFSKYASSSTGGDRGLMAKLFKHRDTRYGTVFSFNLALNGPEDFAGGGTWIETLGRAVHSRAGHLLTHASGVMHGGNPVWSGTRYILVVFCTYEEARRHRANTTTWADAFTKAVTTRDNALIHAAGGPESVGVVGAGLEDYAPAPPIAASGSGSSVPQAADAALARRQPQAHPVQTVVWSWLGSASHLWRGGGV